MASLLATHGLGRTGESPTSVPSWGLGGTVPFTLKRAHEVGAFKRVDAFRVIETEQGIRILVSVDAERLLLSTPVQVGTLARVDILREIVSGGEFRPVSSLDADRILDQAGVDRTLYGVDADALYWESEDLPRVLIPLDLDRQVNEEES